jgi:hypothetical protein
MDYMSSGATLNFCLLTFGSNEITVVIDNKAVKGFHSSDETFPLFPAITHSPFRPPHCNCSRLAVGPDDDDGPGL